MENHPEAEIYIAHRDEEGGRIQTIADHAHGVSERAFNFADGFRGGALARDIGFVHDAGKFSAKFQRRIRGAGLKVEHSTPGAQLLMEQNRSALGMLGAYCVMGHHGGLPDGGSSCDGSDDPTLYGRLKRKTEDCSAHARELTIPRLEAPDFNISDGFGAAFFIRMLFSALVDADFLDTEEFYTSEMPRGGLFNMASLQNRLLAEIDAFLHPREPTSELNARRTHLLETCLSVSENPSGLFTLTAPTGSGKTIASLAFALKHAVKWGKRRVIFVVPYNTIIEQNSAVYEKLLGKENVLQHHSNIQYDDKDEGSDRKRLAAENWDYPVVVTSSVQFFESLYGNLPSVCRKLHNIANSVLIFDEAQMIPLPYLIPCVNAIQELVVQYGCTAVLATATQSALGQYFKKCQATEIADDPLSLYESLRRVRIQTISEEPLTDDDLAERLGRHEQVLCIVHTRKQAQELFQILRAAQPDGTFHLSTLMYPKHRTQVLRLIRARLACGKPCRVVSTSLVEAGVDLDFSVVYRAEAGLDSVVQAGGRCNREGKRPAEESFVYVFSSASHDPPRAIEPHIAAARQALQEHSDAASPEAITAYFEKLFYIKGDKALDTKQVVQKLNDGRKAFSFPFRTLAREFQIIEENTQIVYVLHKNRTLKNRLQGGERSRELFRQLGPYGVSLYRTDMRELLSAGDAMEVRSVRDAPDDEGVIQLIAPYDKYCGVHLSPKGGNLMMV